MVSVPFTVTLFAVRLPTFALLAVRPVDDAVTAPPPTLRNDVFDVVAFEVDA